MQRLVPLALLVSVATLLGVGCGGEGFTQGSGGTPSGGSAGMSSGGGGAGGGGVAGTGGISVGGVTSGGSNGGGGTGQSGSPDGGRGGAPSMTCMSDSDCMNCRYPTAPATKQQCYCANCANTPMTKMACESNDAAYNSVCADVHLPCPAIACIMPKPAVCKDQMCVAGQ